MLSFVSCAILVDKTNMKSYWQQRGCKRSVIEMYTAPKGRSAMRYRKMINCVDCTVGCLRQSIEHESHDTL